MAGSLKNEKHEIRNPKHETNSNDQNWKSRVMLSQEVKKLPFPSFRRTPESSNLTIVLDPGFRRGDELGTFFRFLKQGFENFFFGFRICFGFVSDFDIRISDLKT
jgi:hypothetical protein